jgi:Rrf2 family iron-sulfur cluster assembly transcriptional regulator
MRITTWAEYGVICALHLARRVDEGLVSGRELAEREKLPPDYVEQILLRLRRAGIVASTRGAHGGYALARAADRITLREIMTASELVTFETFCESRLGIAER